MVLLKSVMTPKQKKPSRHSTERTFSAVLWWSTKPAHSGKAGAEVAGAEAMVVMEEEGAGAGEAATVAVEGVAAAAGAMAATGK